MMVRFEVVKNIVLVWFLASLLCETFVDGTSAKDMEPERRISKRNADYNPSPPPGYLAYPGPTSYFPQPASYYPVPYCPRETPATQPPECDSNDEPLDSNPAKRKNCTCSWTVTPAGCTIRLCTPADACAITCHDFKCICNGPSASPDYCVEILPYPETAVVPYIPTPAGGFMNLANQIVSHAHTHQISSLNTHQASIKEAKKQQLLEALAQSSQASQFSRNVQFIQAIINSQKENEFVNTVNNQFTDTNAIPGGALLGGLLGL